VNYLVFKNFSDYQVTPVKEEIISVRKRVPGDLIALVQDHLEKIPLNDGVLGYVAGLGRLLVPVTKNERSFDVYIGMSFTKGVTERKTGRTELILGTQHHIDAMQQQFDNVLWTPEKKSYGDTIRWINVGGLYTGFIGLDYKNEAPQDAGVARNRDDVRFLTQTLLAFGFESKKRLYLLEPPYIRESTAGKRFREQNLLTVGDYARR